MRGYLSVQETAEKWGVSVRWVNQYILNGRIPGVERLGKSWAIPEDVVKPTKQKSGPKLKLQRSFQPTDDKREPLGGFLFYS